MINMDDLSNGSLPSSFRPPSSIIFIGFKLQIGLKLEKENWMLYKFSTFGAISVTNGRSGTHLRYNVKNFTCSYSMDMLQNEGFHSPVISVICISRLI